MTTNELLLTKKKIASGTIEQKIEKLKLELQTLIGTYSYNAYKILSEILALRRKQIRGYMLVTLSRETGINLSEGQIRYIFGYSFATPKSMKLIETGKIQASLVLYLIRKGKIFRNPEKQDEVIDAIITKRIKIDQVSNISPIKILKRIKEGNQTLGNDEFQVRILQKISRLKKEIEQNKKMFDEIQLVKRIKKSVKQLNRVVRRL